MSGELPRIERAADIGYRVQSASGAAEHRKRKRSPQEDGDVLELGEEREERDEPNAAPPEDSPEDEEGLDISI
jgi:hypothetical protein